MALNYFSLNVKLVWKKTNAVLVKVIILSFTKLPLFFSGGSYHLGVKSSVGHSLLHVKNPDTYVLVAILGAAT